MEQYDEYNMDSAVIEDDGNYENQSSPPTQEESSSTQRKSLRLIFYKPRQNFKADDIRTRGYAFNFNLAQHGNYNNVMITSAVQNAAQTKERGKSCFAWKDEKTVLRFKMEVTDISTALLVLRYKQGLCELVHKSGDGNVTSIFSLSSVRFRPDEATQTKMDNFVKGEKPYRSSVDALDPLSINMKLSKTVNGKTSYHIARLSGGEAQALEMMLADAALRIMEKDAEWTPRS